MGSRNPMGVRPGILFCFLAINTISSIIPLGVLSSSVKSENAAEQIDAESKRLDGGFLGKIFSTLLRGVGRYSHFPFGCNCNHHYEPVCGTDGVTYPNRCYLHCRGKASMLNGFNAGMKRSSASTENDESADGAEERTLKYYQELGPGGSLGCALLPDGSDYAGHVEFTRTGRRCARWDTHRDTYPITPEHPFTPIQDYNFPEQSITAARNFCRNPDRDRRGPWCFTGSPHEPYNFDFCEVPHCGDPYNIYMNGLGGAGMHPGNQHGYPDRPGGLGYPDRPGGLDPAAGFPQIGGGVNVAHEGPCNAYIGYPPFDQHPYRRLEDGASLPAAEEKTDRELSCSNSEEYDTRCKSWAREGKCLKSFAFMKAHCPKSCFPSVCAGSSMRSPDEAASSDQVTIRFPK